MTMNAIATGTPETFWRRWIRRIAAFEEAMDMTHDDVQDRRMDRLEAELAKLRADLLPRSATEPAALHD